MAKNKLPTIIGNRVLVEKIPEQQQEGFASVAVDTQDNFVCKGKVVTIGSGVPREQYTYNVKIGDEILFAKYSPDTHEIVHNGITFKVIDGDDILAIL